LKDEFIRLALTQGTQVYPVLKGKEMNIQPYTLTPEREEQLIDKIAKTVVDRHMEAPTILFLESVKPLSFVAGQIGTVYLSPLTSLLGSWSEEGLALLRKRENAERLLRKIEELSKEKKKGR